MIFIVGMERYPDQCVVQLIDVENGKYLLPKTFKNGDPFSYAENVMDLLLRLRPSQIIFDEYGGGNVFKDIFAETFKKTTRHSGIAIWGNGEIMY